jgi:putative N6-adenine-specific DNA methylase
VRRDAPVLVATCARGTEPALAAELDRLGGREIKPQHGGVRFAVDDVLRGGVRACLHLRSAQRVLMPLATFAAADDAELFAGALEVPWERWLTPRHTFAVSATSRAAPPLAHAAHVALRIKDAIADRLRDRAGARPDVHKDDPDVAIYAHLESAARSRGGVPAVTVGLDVGGGSLHARGYRVAEVAAPLRETLAASVLGLAGWDGRRPLIDPTCGSGTIVIEAALLALDLAPGLVANRPPAIARWPGYGEAEARMVAELIAEARARVRPRAAVQLVGLDRDPLALAAAEKNARAAGVAHAIVWRLGDARQFAALSPPGDVICNPPYGERVGATTGLEAFTRAFGQHLRRLDGHRAFVLAPEKTQRWLAMRAAWSTQLKNGPIDVVLARYQLGQR